MTEQLHVEGVLRAELAAPDIDAGFGLRLETLVRRCIDTGYAIGRDHMHGVSLRNRTGMASTIVYLRVDRMPLRVAVGQPLEIHYRMRFGRRTGSGQTAQGGILREFVCELRSPEGTGELARPREVVDETPRDAAHLRMVTADVRPGAPAGERVLRELPEELQHFVVHDLGAGYPDSAELQRTDDGMADVELDHRAVRNDVWPLDSTDMNGIVFTGKYVSAVDAHHARCLKLAAPAIAGVRSTEIELLFKRAFRSDESFVMRAQLATAAARAVSRITVHAGDDAAYDPRPALIARVSSIMGDRAAGL